MDNGKILVFTGAGISAESGLRTFRGADGLWNEQPIENVATPEGWARDPATVLDFYNQRRKAVAAASPNVAHRAIAQLEEKYEVVVITQNVDDLHERAGSTQIIHLHGKISEARSVVERSYVVEYPAAGISLEQRCPKGGLLRPNVVWFGEEIENFEVSAVHFRKAGKVLVVGTSLTVYPAAGLLDLAERGAERIIVAMDVERCPHGYRFMRGRAGEIVPSLVAQWLKAR